VSLVGEAGLRYALKLLGFDFFVLGLEDWVFTGKLVK
jgi:hypothetical protein